MLGFSSTAYTFEQGKFWGWNFPQFLLGGPFLLGVGIRHGFAIVPALLRHGFAMVLAQLRHGFAMVLALLRHGFAMGFCSF